MDITCNLNIWHWNLYIVYNSRNLYITSFLLPNSSESFFFIFIRKRKRKTFNSRDSTSQEPFLLIESSSPSLLSQLPFWFFPPLPVLSLLQQFAQFLLSCFGSVVGLVSFSYPIQPVFSLIRILIINGQQVNKLNHKYNNKTFLFSILSVAWNFFSYSQVSTAAFSFSYLKFQVIMRK